MILGSSRVSSRRFCALPSNPPPASATWSSAGSPLCPNGGWPMSCARPARSTRSGSQPSASPMLAADLRDLQRVGQPGARRRRPRRAGRPPASCRPAGGAPPSAAPGPGRGRSRCAVRFGAGQTGVLRRLDDHAGTVVRRRRASTRSQVTEPLCTEVRRRVGQLVPQQRAGLARDAVQLGLAGEHRRPLRVGAVHASRPSSRAIVRVRSECHGSLTSTTDDRSRARSSSPTASILSSVSEPSSTATIASAGTPCSIR